MGSTTGGGGGGGAEETHPPTKMFGGGHHLLYPPNHDGSAVGNRDYPCSEAISLVQCMPFLQAPQLVYFTTYDNFEWK